MNPLDIAIHLLNFGLPALAVGALMVPAARLALGPAPAAPNAWLQVAVNVGAGLLALLAGLAVFGHDGKMASYVALVLACASSQWLLRKSWR